MTKPTVLGAIAKAIRFLRDEDGAITIDWIALTAAMVFLGAATGYFATSGLPMLASKVDTTLETMTVMPN